jgi:release factor glutamine methyltransferase
MNLTPETPSNSPQSSADPVVWTTMSVLKWSIQFLKSKGFATPRLDAEILLSKVLECSRVQLYTQFDKPLSEDERARFKNFLRRRVSEEPIAYITGSREFYGRRFLVGPEVLIPRPDTELLVEIVVSKVRSSNMEAPKLLDLCTGSGCIAISLALELPGAVLTALDCSSAALDFAKLNANALLVSDRIEFIIHDLLKHGFKDTKRYDFLVSNPPYISTSEVEELDEGVRKFEPKLALDGGADGMNFYRSILSQVPTLLNPGGFVAVEIGFDQGSRVEGLFVEAGLQDVEVRRDLAGNDRVVLGRWP